MKIMRIHIIYGYRHKVFKAAQRPRAPRARPLHPVARVRQKCSLIYVHRIEWVGLQRLLTTRASGTSHETPRMNHCTARSASSDIGLTDASRIQRCVHAKANYLFYHLYTLHLINPAGPPLHLSIIEDSVYLDENSMARVHPIVRLIERKYYTIFVMSDK